MTKVNIESAAQIKTFDAESIWELDKIVNDFLKGIELKCVRDVKLSTTYESELCQTNYIALVTYSYAKVKEFTD